MNKIIRITFGFSKQEDVGHIFNDGTILTDYEKYNISTRITFIQGFLFILAFILGIILF